MVVNYWRNAPARQKRLIAGILSFLILIVATVGGALTPLSVQDADALNRNLEQTRQSVQNMTIIGGALAIFQNNFLLSLGMFVPFLGPFFSVYVMYNTGLVIAAESMSTTPPLPGVLVLLLLFVFPHTWMEFAAYSIAFSESIWLSRRIIQRKLRPELTNALQLILIVLLILLAAAFVEILLIKALI